MAVRKSTVENLEITKGVLTMELMDFYKGKKVFVTGHTGFKGTWLCKILLMAGAQVTGYSTEPPTDPSLFHLCNMAGQMNSVTGDVRCLKSLHKAMEAARPELFCILRHSLLSARATKIPLKPMK